MKIRNLLLLTSGGDAPGMNAAIRAVVRTALFSDVDVFVSPYGYRGLVEKAIEPITAEGVANCIQRGGTILKSSRCPEFHDKHIRAEVAAYLKAKKMDALVVIGGDGSFRGATLLTAEANLQVLGIPATIDNDIVGTEYTIGFDTARNTALILIDRIRDTASSNEMYFLIEVMGKRAGFLALDVGIAGGADLILTPEFPLTMEALAERLTRPARVKQSLLAVIAEAGEPGRTLKIAEYLKAHTPFDYRVCILGHTQRGGSPTALDRDIASRMGYMAVNQLLAGVSNKMIAMRNNSLCLADFPDPEKSSRKLVSSDQLKLAEILAS